MEERTDGSRLLLLGTGIFVIYMLCLCSSVVKLSSSSSGCADIEDLKVSDKRFVTIESE